MTYHSRSLKLGASVAAVALLVTSAAPAATIVDDSFADADFAKTGPLDTNWWTSSSSSGKEISAGSLGLVTGSSGRGIHTIFPTQTLANVGDSIVASYTFTTPATVGTNRSTAFRVGLFDHLGRAGLDADVSASSGSPNELFGWGVALGGPGTQTLPGFMFDHDVNTDTDDLNFRQHLVSTITGTGRLMSTTDNFDNVSPSGPDEAYEFLADTQYSGSFSITRISATEVELAGALVTPAGTATHSVTATFDSADYSMLGFHANSNTFGSSNSGGDPDNGIDFSNIKIEFFAVPEPTSLLLLAGSLALLTATRTRRR